MEKELLDLRKKVTLLEYDLHEAKNSQKQLQSQKEKLEGEVKWCVFATALCRRDSYLCASIRSAKNSVQSGDSCAVFHQQLCGPLCLLQCYICSVFEVGGFTCKLTLFVPHSRNLARTFICRWNRSPTLKIKSNNRRFNCRVRLSILRAKLLLLKRPSPSQTRYLFRLFMSV